MRAFWMGLIVAAMAYCGGAVLAQGPAGTEYARFTFPTKPEISIKLSKASNGKPVRGKMISLTATEVIVDTGALSRRDRERGEVGQRIGFDRIESLRSTDGRFQFEPSEDYEVISKRVRAAYRSVRVLKDEDAIADETVDPEMLTGDQLNGLSMIPGSFPKPGAAAAVPGSMTQIGPGKAGPGKTGPKQGTEDMTDPARQKPGKPMASGLGKGGFGGLKNLPKTNKPGEAGSEDPSMSQEDSETEGTETSTDVTTMSTSTSADGVTEILFCSKCTKEIPSSAVKSGVCPFCKTPFSNVAYAPSTVPKSPFATPTGPANAGAGAFQATGTAPVAGQGQADPVNNTGTVVVQGGGFTFDSIPNWAKGGMFILLVLVGYHLLFNR